MLLEDRLHARGVDLYILTGICAGIRRPDGAALAGFGPLAVVGAMAAEMERDLIADGLRAAEAQGRRSGSSRRCPISTCWPSPAPGSPAASRSPSSRGA